MSFSTATSNDYINQFNENTQKFLSPWKELNKTFVKNAEQMAEFSLNTIRTYTQMGLDNMCQIAKIDSPQAAKEFSANQADILNQISQQIMVDAKHMAEIGSNMQDEVMKVMSEVYGQTNEHLQSTLQKTADQAAKNAKEFTSNVNNMAEQASQDTSDVKTAAKPTSPAPNNSKTADAEKSNSSAKTTINKP